MISATRPRTQVYQREGRPIASPMFSLSDLDREGKNRSVSNHDKH
jgi:hypothetical protein